MDKKPLTHEHGWRVAYKEALETSGFRHADDIEEFFRLGWMSCIVNAPEDPDKRQDGASAAGPRGQLYTASKTRHAEKWRALRAAGYPVNSTWIDEAGPGESADLTDLWVRCIREASEAACVLVYAEDGDVLKGAFVEVGCALALGKPVLAVGLPSSLSMLNHPLVEVLPTLDEAVACAKEICAGVREVVQESQPAPAPAAQGEAPKAPRKPSPAAVVIAQALEHGGQGDEHDQAEMVMDALEEMGYRIVHASAQPPAASQGMREAVEAIDRIERLLWAWKPSVAVETFAPGKDLAIVRAALSRSQEAPAKEGGDREEPK